MEGLHSMSHLMFNQVEQIADVKTCSIDNVEQRYYKVQWKCTWEPAIVLERFCGKIIADYEKGPSSCRTQVKTVEKTKRQSVSIEKHVGLSGNSLNLSNKGSDKICSTNEVQNFLIEKISTTNNKLNNKLNLHNLNIKTEPDKEPGETCPTKSAKDVINESLPPYNFEIKPDLNDEIFPSINILNENDDANFNHTIVEEESNFYGAITAEEPSFNHAITTEESSFNNAITAEESNFANKDRIDDITASYNKTPSYSNLFSNICSKDSSVTGLIKKHETKLSINCFKCHLCSYFAPERSKLKRHMSKHTGEKPFKCSLCSYSASQKHKIKSHMGKHTGDYRFKCDWCPYSTNFHTDLKRHLMTHTGEKPFKCDQCDYRTIRKAHLKHHLKCIHKL